MSMSVIIIVQGAGAEGVRPRCVHDKEKERRDINVALSVTARGYISNKILYMQKGLLIRLAR